MGVDTSQYKEMFLSEAREHLQAMNTALLKLEKNPKDLKHINEIFRAAHTLKGMAATMEYKSIADLSHEMENVLSDVREKKLELQTDIIDVLFQCFDTLENLVERVSKDQKESEIAPLVEKLKAVAKQKKIEKEKTKTPPAEEPKGAKLAEKPHTIQKIKEIKVGVERLDTLMNLVEEILVNKMSLDQVESSGRYQDLRTVLDHTSRLITDLQYNVTEARMVPIEFIFNRFPRMVRDLSKKQGKDIDLVIQGHEIEFDRTIIDQIGEPLVHLLRNAVDHGIEAPEERKKAGKPSTAKVKLTARRERGYAIIDVEDDGRGLDLEEIKKTALRKGIIKEAEGLSREQVIELLFDPRFSTTKKVTAVSGRGIGLNVVKEKTEALGGEVKVDSQPKKGSRFTLELPLTLAIIKALLVGVGEEEFAIPITNIVRSVKVQPKKIKSIENQDVIVINNEDIPLIRLNKVFNIETPASDGETLAVIVKKGEDSFAVGVDSLINEQEIIIKPVSPILKENKALAGFTILGTGKVILILDIAGLI